MSDITDITEDLVEATEKAKNGAAIIDVVANGGVGQFADTASGPLPSFAEFYSQKTEELGNVQEIRDDLNALDTAAIKSSTVAAANSAFAKTIPFRGRFLFDVLADGPSPLDFGGSRNSSNDSTSAFNQARAEAVSHGAPLVLNASFGGSQFVIDGASGLTIRCSGSLTGLDPAQTGCVLVLKNSSDVSIYGRLVIAGGWAANQYAGGFAMFTDNGTQCSLLDITGVHFAGCRNTFLIGRLTEPDALCSEITIGRSYAYGCPSGPVVVGTQTVVGFVEPNMITGTNGSSAPSWLALPRVALTVKGSTVTISQGEVLIVDVATGLLFDIQPIGGSAIGNQYGSIHAKLVTLETASQLVQFRNPAGITGLAPGVGSFHMDGCFGFHSQNVAPLIQAADDFTGTINIGYNPIKYSTTSTRTQQNISVGAADCHIKVQDDSFGPGFKVGLAGVSGGRVEYSQRDILRANTAAPLGGTTATQFAAGAQTVVVFANVFTTGDLARFSNSYNNATGTFTIGKEGAKSVKASIRLRPTNKNTSGYLAVFINGAYLTNSPIQAGNGTISTIQAEFSLGDLAAGTVIDFRLTMTAASALDGAGLDTLTINARA